MREALYRFWLEPKAADPPPVSWRDWLFALVLLTIGLATILTDEGVWLPGALVLVFGGSLLIPWRRAFPLAIIIAFSVYATLQVLALTTEVEGRLAGTWSLLVLLYALTRWASGRQVFFGVAIFAVGFFLGRVARGGESTELLIGGMVFWIAPILIGITVRTQAQLSERRVLEARLKERHALARELHDTVAHHVSAITIQAQAGRAGATTDTQAATRALAVIEEESSRTLNEMRKMVGALRDDEPVELAPQRGLGDIERLALLPTGGLPVEVQLAGDLEDLGPSVEAGLVRLALEAITNARKHARRATQIGVNITGSDSDVCLTVADDGESVVSVGSRRRRRGYGLVGMAERTKLLGGTFEAGPGPTGGWVIEAALPRLRKSATS